MYSAIVLQKAGFVNKFHWHPFPVPLRRGSIKEKSAFRAAKRPKVPVPSGSPGSALAGVPDILTIDQIVQVRVRMMGQENPSFLWVNVGAHQTMRWAL
ncbi:MAG: hypothetical protein LUG55_06295 [Clostridiales bacterium]|nr:hypothetical protein [Clostridiales bacterium]